MYTFYITLNICVQWLTNFDFSLLRLQVKKDDILPKNVCQKCLSSVNFISEFVDRFQKSDEILQRSLQCSEIVPEIEIEEHGLSLEPDVKTESVTMKEKPKSEKFVMMEEETVADDSSNSKYYLHYIIH